MAYTYHCRTIRDWLRHLPGKSAGDFRKRKHLLVDRVWYLHHGQHAADVQSHFWRKRAAYRDCLCRMDGHWRCWRCSCRHPYFQGAGHILAVIFRFHVDCIHRWPQSSKPLIFQKPGTCCPLYLLQNLNFNPNAFCKRMPFPSGLWDWSVNPGFYISGHFLTNVLANV